MADYLARAGGYVNWELEQQITEEQMENMGQIGIATLYSGFLARLFLDEDSSTPQSGFWAGDDCKLTKINSTTVEIAAGIGYYYDTTDTDDFYSVYKPIVVATAFQETIAAADTNKHRYDIVCLAPATEEDTTETEQFYTGPSTSEPDDTETRTKFTYAVQVVTGTEVVDIATPSVPSTPAGYIICGRIHVDDTGVLTVSDALRDKLVMTDSMRYNKIESEGDLEIVADDNLTIEADSIEVDAETVTFIPTIEAPGNKYTGTNGYFTYDLSPAHEPWAIYDYYPDDDTFYPIFYDDDFIRLAKGWPGAIAGSTILRKTIFKGYKESNHGSIKIRNIRLRYLNDAGVGSLHFYLKKKKRSDSSIETVVHFSTTTEIPPTSGTKADYEYSTEIDINDLDEYNYFIEILMKIEDDEDLQDLRLYDVELKVTHEGDNTIAA